MKKKESDTKTDEFSIPLPSSLDLRGRQSARATFKLSERAIDAISIVAVHPDLPGRRSGTRGVRAKCSP